MNEYSYRRHSSILLNRTVYRLPLDPVMLVISELMPKLHELQSLHKSNPAGAILDYLGHISLKHVLPTAPPLNPRKFIVSCYCISSRYIYISEPDFFLSVVRGVPGVALFVNLGRDLRARYDAPGDLELCQRPIILREARAKPSASAHRDGVECSWGTSWSRDSGATTTVKATFGPYLTRALQ